MNHDKLKELFFSEQLEERKLGFAMMQQLGFLAAREFRKQLIPLKNDDSDQWRQYIPLLIAFEVPKYLSYGHPLLSPHRFERVRLDSRCPVRTKPILTYGKYDSHFLKILFVSMQWYGQDVTVANEKGWRLTIDSTEEDWNYKVGKNESLYLTGMRNISWDHMKY